jgi:GNAT superfamily N-acetyltransferase
VEAADLAELERSIVESVAPARLLETHDWLIPLDDGAIGRAKSAAPLSHDVGPASLDNVERAYAAAGLPPAFRVAETPGLAPVAAELARRGYRPDTPTIMKLGSAAALGALDGEPAELLPAPDEAWIATFAGEGFDPAESAQRIRNLTRSPDVRFGAVRDPDGRVAAVGVVSFGRGWAGVHGMRTAPDRRGQGLAGRVLAAFGRVALARSVDRVALQVTEANPARSLYRRAGFSAVWRYQYWRKD